MLKNATHTADSVSVNNPETLEAHFLPFRRRTIGIQQTYPTPYGKQKMIYADWTASGRLYGPIEAAITEQFGPYMANTHSESSLTGQTISQAYKMARQIIKQHVNAGPDDILMLTGSGMTSGINKLQRLLGLKVPEWQTASLGFTERDRPVIFVSHMEHHSNHISWAETIGDVIMLEPGEDGEVSPAQLERSLNLYKHRHFKIGAFTACSNVTGRTTPYHQLAKVMHQHRGICIVDFAASAPYVPIDMHPAQPLEQLDGILFSPHKFLGGPGTCGVLIVRNSLCSHRIPDHVGGGTVDWVNPWGTKHYVRDMEKREDGGTPPIIQTIKTALCMKLKEKMRPELILAREHQLTVHLLRGLERIPGVDVLGANSEDRLGIVSWIIQGYHYNLVVKLLSDRFGIQARGGCSCAGPYGHYLLGITPELSRFIEQSVINGDYSFKPGWIRTSLHPIMTLQEVDDIIHAVTEIARHIETWQHDYIYNPLTNDWSHIHGQFIPDVAAMFEIRF
ncbi:MAG TPA: aminotransferase class V-fold PLP-dependent enzyme [Paenibacillus sp.]